MNIRNQDSCRRGIPRTTKGLRPKFLREGIRIQMMRSRLSRVCVKERRVAAHNDLYPQSSILNPNSSESGGAS